MSETFLHFFNYFSQRYLPISLLFKFHRKCNSMFCDIDNDTPPLVKKLKGAHYNRVIIVVFFVSYARNCQ